METPEYEYDYNTYGEARVWLDDGAYTLSKLKELVACLERMNAANAARMKEIPNA